MLPHKKSLAFAGEQPSGAPLGLWRTRDFTPPTVCEAVQVQVELGLRGNLPSTQQLAEQIAGCQDRVIRERLERACQRRLAFGDADHFAMPIWAWRLGDALVIGTPSEAYSRLQTQLRERFPDRPVVVMNMVNGYASYLPPANAYSTEAYQVDVSLFEAGSLEATAGACEEVLRRLGADRPRGGDVE